MKVLLSEGCEGCDASELCAENIVTLSKIEQEAAAIGSVILEGEVMTGHDSSLVAQGSVICTKGPRAVLIDGIQEERRCRANPTLPFITCLELADKASKAWPEAKDPRPQELWEQTLYNTDTKPYNSFGRLGEVIVKSIISRASTIINSVITK